MSHIEAIEDNYPEYDRDQLGYHYDAWDLTPPAQVLAHDRIALLDGAALAAYAPTSDLERLGLLHAHLRRGAPDQARPLALALISGAREDAAVAYEDLGLWLAKEQARDGDLTAALATIEGVFAWMTDTPEESRARLSGEVLLAGGDHDGADARFAASLGPEDQPLSAERAYEICALWHAAGDADRTAAWAARCQACAASSRNTAVLVDLKLLTDVG